MAAQIIGKENVCKYIKMCQTTKFVIYRKDTHKNSDPIFEWIEKGDNDKAIEKFTIWAECMNNAVIYELKLFNSKEDSEDLGEEVANKKKGKVYNVSFQINEISQNNFLQAQQQNQNLNTSELIENALLKMQMKNNENELMKKMAELDEKFNKFIEEEEEEEDDMDQLSGLNNPNILNLIGLLTQSLGGKKATPTAINGLDADKIANINKAVKILAKYDSEIDTDLLKLSSLAENQTATFEMLLKTLRNM